MVKIRLSQTGTKHKLSYRIIVSEARKKRDGKSIETLGFYDPKTKPPTVKVNQERLNYWLKQGAVPTDTVRKLLNNEKAA